MMRRRPAAPSAQQPTGIREDEAVRRPRRRSVDNRVPPPARTDANLLSRINQANLERHQAGIVATPLILQATQCPLCCVNLFTAERRVPRISLGQPAILGAQVRLSCTSWCF